ncbi:cGMP-specific 3',5'-cyclic phosphodiesterase-like isoform X3 [Mytilus galloprovincialis]|uniref:cGMP-specific 3',5'-cyclic phosphodiesterase-like isoform X1 n=1 Tax=Mytilus edulis TaxID=6550 RepID=UPI0039F10566
MKVSNETTEMETVMEEPKMSGNEVEQFLLNNTEFIVEHLKKHGTPTLIKKISDIKPSTPRKMPMFNTAPRNSITTSMFKRYVEGNLTRIKQERKNMTELKKMSEAELFTELIKDIATELDVNVLCHKILQNVNILTKSDRSSLFLVRGSKENRHLVSKLFDVTETSTLQESLHTEETEIKVPFGRGIAGYVAQAKDTVNITDAYEDPRFNNDIDKKTGYRTMSILCMPISNYEGEVIGVAQIINKAGNGIFTVEDERLFEKYLTFCGIGLTNAQLFEMSVMEYKRNQMLLNLARGVFTEQTNLDKLIKKIMLDAQGLLKCERCSVYLIDDSLEGDYNHPDHEHEEKKITSTQDVVFSKAFDLYPRDGGNFHVPSAALLKTSRNAEIARHVVVAAVPLNIADITQENDYCKGSFDEDQNFKTKSVLCMPIYNSDKKIIGVTQLINKINGNPFNESDANTIEAFSIFTGLGIHNCQMYENACKLMAKQSVALEVLSYHATAQNDETEKLMTCDIPAAENLGLYTYEFNDLPMSEDETLKSTIAMFRDSNIIKNFRIPYDVICRWTCSVKKNYRPVTYHNWRHAFNVAQTMFTILYTGGLIPLFDDLEVFALLAGCLCHDLDHRGTNNAFQVKVESPLAMLYSTSVMEHHHFDHCIMILNSEGNNIFQSLSSEEYRKVIKMLEHAILSTDLALYFKKRGDFKKIVDEGEKEFQEPIKKDLLKAMMMTVCDVAAITKPWEVQYEVAHMVANEFFEQGDIEKTQLGEKPIAMMDRDKQDELPKMQVGFIDAICIPVYKMFAELNPGLEPMFVGVSNNRNNWQALAEDNERKINGNGQAKTTEKDKENEKEKDEIKEENDSPQTIKPPRTSKVKPDQPLTARKSSIKSKQITPQKKVAIKEPKGKTKICMLM